ncbi:uncharacterized protein LOC117180219 [Belonocnema kinseyi]|uniref:uncharacterized protein LOC117180219 n=1 Tax=Belonocnema kinseyi TaxID=2817044 RepID=UPI00143D7463|nr:uncharacterized protein LOC117180219 [Belonocnema kinseyi]
MIGYLKSKSTVCEEHFKSIMWETINNKRRLKKDAFPTLFPSLPVRKRKSDAIFMRSGKTISYAPQENPPHVTTKELTEENSREPHESPRNLTAEEKVKGSSLDGVMADNVIVLLQKQEQKIKALKIRLQKALDEKRKLERDGHANFKNVLMSLFVEDQIRNLVKLQRAKGKPRPKAWSNTTIKKALRLKFTCGNTGYDELLRQGFP